MKTLKCVCHREGQIGREKKAPPVQQENPARALTWWRKSRRGKIPGWGIFGALGQGRQYGGLILAETSLKLWKMKDTDHKRSEELSKALTTTHSVSRDEDRVAETWPLGPTTYQAGSSPGQPTHPGLQPSQTITQHCPGRGYPRHIEHSRKWTTSENELIPFETMPRDPGSAVPFRPSQRKHTHDFESFLGERLHVQWKQGPNLIMLGKCLRACNEPSSHHFHPQCVPTFTFLNLVMSIISFLPFFGCTYLTSYNLR